VVDVQVVTVGTTRTSTTMEKEGNPVRTYPKYVIRADGLDHTLIMWCQSMARDRGGGRPTGDREGGGDGEGGQPRATEKQAVNLGRVLPKHLIRETTPITWQSRGASA
jgi:hypothetical protein